MVQDLSFPPNEQIILNAWKLYLTPSLSTPIPGSTTKISPSHREAPQDRYHKINFEVASKGNMGPTGLGVSIHNKKGEILHILVGNLGHNTYNVAEIWGFLKGLQAAKDQGINFLIEKGESQIIINLLSHLLNGAEP